MYQAARRRRFRKQYQPSAKKKIVQKPYQVLQQPEWDDTIHDLSQLQLSADEQLRRRLSRVSKNQLGVALLNKLNCSNGSASARYSPSIGSTEDRAQTDSDDDGRSKTQLMHQSRCMAVKQQQTYQGGPLESDTDDDICQWQDAAHSPLHQRAVLGDIGNTSRTNHHQRDSHLKQLMRQSGPGQHADTAQAIPHIPQGHIAVPTATLQALFDKIESLEQQLKQQPQQQESRTPTQENHQLQQHTVSGQQELSEAQQQLAHVQAEHRQYVSHTSSLLIQLQAQLQELMRQSPNHTEAVDNFVRQLHISEAAAPGSASLSSAAAAAATATPHFRRQHPRISSILQTLGPAPLSSSDGSSRHGVSSPSKQHLRAATAVAMTASPRKSVIGLVKDPSPGSAPCGTAGFGRTGGTGAAAVDAVPLPSYAQMRQQNSLTRASAIGLGTTTAKVAPTASATAEGWTGAAATTDEANTSTSMTETSGCSSTEAAVLPTDLPDRIASSAAFRPPFSKSVPHPIMAPTSTVSAAAGLASRANQHLQEQAPGHWSNAAQVAPVIADCNMDASATMLHPSLAANTGLPGLRDTDWGLQQGLPLATVGRIFTDAGRFESVEMLKPRVLLDQLKGNMSLSDHLRAAKSVSGALSGVKALGL